MSWDAIIYKPDGTSSLVMYRGEPLRAVQRHAKGHVESGYATRVEIRDLRRRLIAQHPRILRRA